MPGIAHTKFTLNDLKTLHAHALQHRVETSRVVDNEMAIKFNKMEQLISRLLGVPVYKTWKTGDRYYSVPIKSIDEKEDAFVKKIRNKKVKKK